jgi:hypothetical protein
MKKKKGKIKNKKPKTTCNGSKLGWTHDMGKMVEERIRTNTTSSPPSECISVKDGMIYLFLG